MARILPIFTKQVCIYWAPTAPNNYGKVGFADPIAVECRWDDKASQFIDANNDVAVSRSEVMCGIPMELNGALWLVPADILRDATDPTNATWESRALAMLPSYVSPLDIPGCWQIRQREATPNYNNTETIYQAIL